MGFFNRDDGETQQPQPAEQAVTADPAPAEAAPHAGAYQAGSLAGIPESGRQRIERMKQEVARGFFTSDLSVNEFLLVKHAGFEPWAWSSAARSTTSGSSRRTGARTRRWAYSPRPCTTRVSWP